MNELSKTYPMILLIILTNGFEKNAHDQHYSVEQNAHPNVI